MSILEISGISKSFGGVHAVRDVTFSVEEGEICVVRSERPRAHPTQHIVFKVSQAHLREMQYDPEYRIRIRK